MWIYTVVEVAQKGVVSTILSWDTRYKSYTKVLIVI
jgi:hypothetical protein